MDDLLLSAARIQMAASDDTSGGRGGAPLKDIANLLERHSELTWQVQEAKKEAESLRLQADLQERLESFDAQIVAGVPFDQGSTYIWHTDAMLYNTLIP